MKNPNLANLSEQGTVVSPDYSQVDQFIVFFNSVNKNTLSIHPNKKKLDRSTISEETNK